MPQLVRVVNIFKYLTKRWTDGKMKIIAGRRNRSRDPMSDKQALYPLRHVLVPMLPFEKRTILMKSRNSIWDRS